MVGRAIVIDDGSSRPAAGELLAEAKLAAPRLRAGMVKRSRIMAALDAGDESTLTLVAAPPGYGKTTAVRAWCEERGRAVVWLTLDAGDDDPSRLWTYVATGVERAINGRGRAAMQRLRQAGGSPDAAIDELMNALAGVEQELVIVLDDAQTVTDEECLASIEHALTRRPPTTRLIVITRTDPELEIAQLRASGLLTELRADDLAFTTAEANELLVQRGRLELTPDDVELLHRRTEGWPAALLLAWVWLGRVDDPRRAVREFGGDHRFVVDYLSEVAFGALDDELCAFLLRVSVLRRFTAELCDAVLDRADCATVLARLEHANLFVTELEHGGWFRVHPLFAEFAGFRLTSLDPGAVVDIHRRAATWLRARGLIAEAAEHAAQAGDHEVVAELLVEHHLTLIRGGRARTLLEWADRLPDECLVNAPELAVGAATAAQMIGHHALEQRRLLHLADRSRVAAPIRFGPHAQAVSNMLRAASADGALDDAVKAGRRAVQIAEANADDVLVASLGGYARALYFAGRLDEAWQAAMRAIEHPDVERRPPGHAFARSTLAFVAADCGRMASARLHAEKAKAIVGGIGGSRSWLGANATAALGLVLLGEGRYLEADRHLTQAERFFRDEVATRHHAWLLVVLARVRARAGHLHEAQTTLRAARDAIDELADRSLVALLLSDVEREITETTARVATVALLDRPSNAELAVLRLLGSELSVREIAAELYVSPNTVRSHTRALYRKLGVNCRSDAVGRADALGLTGGPSSPM